MEREEGTEEEVRVGAYAINGLKLIVPSDLSGAAGEDEVGNSQQSAASAAIARCRKYNGVHRFNTELGSFGPLATIACGVHNGKSSAVIY